MKHLSFLLAFALLALAACKKNEGPQQPITYRINGITDLKMQDGGGAFMELDLEYVGPVQERVSLSFSGLPQGVEAQFNNQSGTVPFNTWVLVGATGATPGTYPIKLLCNGSATGEHSYDLTLTISPTPCGEKLPGAYIGSGSCGGSFASNISFGFDNKLYIHNLGGTFITAEIKVNCDNGTFTIPPQSVGNDTLTGSGSFVISGSTVVISLQYNISGSFPVSCTATMSM